MFLRPGAGGKVDFPLPYEKIDPLAAGQSYRPAAVADARGAESTRTVKFSRSEKVSGLAGCQWRERWEGSRGGIKRGLRALAGRSLARLSSWWGQ